MSASGASIPIYQWQFLSASEEAAVDASVNVIMNERFKNVTLNISDDGVPYAGTLHLKQTFTDFTDFAGFECDYQDDLLAVNPSRSCMVHVRWDQVEPVQGEWDFSSSDSEYADAVGHNMNDLHIFLGPSVEKCPPWNCYYIPGWATSLWESAGNSSDYESLKDAMREYVEMVVSHFKGRIEQYELWWEANAFYGNDDWPLDRIIDIIKIEALTIRAVDSAAKIFVDLVWLTPDEIQYLTGSSNNNWTTEYFVQQLLAAGVPFDVIGLETHIGTGSVVNAGDITTLYNGLIELSEFGKSLYIWEDGLESYLPPAWVAQEQGSWWWVGTWHGTPSEAKQAEYLVAETLVYLGNPSVIGVRWVSIWDDPVWSTNLSDCGLLYTNGTRKKSFYAVEALWNSLMVNGNVQSVNGVATFRGLPGNYSISAEGYTIEPSTFHVSEGNENTIPLVLRSTAVATTSITPTTGGAYYTTAQTSPGLVIPMNYMEYLEVIVLLAAIAIGAIWISLRRARIRAAARQRPSGGVQFCINCGDELQPNSKFCGKCGAAQT